MKFNHVGIPTAGSFDGEIPLPHLKMTVSDHLSNPFGNLPLPVGWAHRQRAARQCCRLREPAIVRFGKGAAPGS